MVKPKFYYVANPEELVKKDEHEHDEEEEDPKKKKKDEEVINKKFFNPYDLKCLLIAKFAGVEVELVPSKPGETNKTPEFVKLSPSGTFPLLSTEKGAIWQSGAIAKYFANSSKNTDLRGDGIHAAQVDQLCEFVESNWSDVGAMIRLLVEGKKVGKNEEKAAQTQLEKVNAVIGHILDVNTYLCGDRLSIADLTVFAHYRWLFVLLWEAEERKKVRSITRWFQSIANHKLVKEVVGEIKLKEKKEKKIESKFNMEEWKRVFMNSPAEESIKWFWDHLDVKVNSVWIANYKYNDDLKGQESFMVMNKLGGVVQRLEDFRKTTFGVLCIVGPENASEITCMWVYEEKIVPKEISAETDYEMFDWVRIDWGKDKAKVNEYLTQKGTIGGKAIVEVKNFR